MTIQQLIPYLIPSDFPVVIQFSGGRTSGYMLKQILDANNGLPANAHVLFQNTGREFGQTLDFVHRCGEQWGVKITWLEYRPELPLFDVVNHNSASRNGEPFEALIRKRKYVPNVVTRYCSDVLKYRTAKRYMVSLGHKKWYSVIGFRADEAGRVEKIMGRKHSREIILTPLFHAGVVKKTVSDFWDNAGFDLDLQNIGGKTPLGNCDGCFLKAEKNLARLCREYPEKAQWWIEMEKITGATFNKKFSMSELASVTERMPEFAFDDDADAFCNNTYGTCEGF